MPQRTNGNFVAKPQAGQAQPQMAAAANANANGQAKSWRRRPRWRNWIRQQRAAFLKLIGANWIWSPAYKKDEVPVGDCYFRKTFQLTHAEFGQVHIACDNQYELYVNGRLVGKGERLAEDGCARHATSFWCAARMSWRSRPRTPMTGAAGLVARVIIKEKGGTFESYSTDATWKTSVKAAADWAQPKMRDNDWLAAKVYGPLGGVLPWGDEIVIADEGSRFLDRSGVRCRAIRDRRAGRLADRDGVQRERRYPGFARRGRAAV